MGKAKIIFPVIFMVISGVMTWLLINSIVIQPKGKYGTVTYKALASLMFVATGIASMLCSNPKSVLPKGTTFGVLLIMGLVFSMIGDVILQFPSKNDLFLLGAAAFGVGHLFYVISFFKIAKFKWVDIATFAVIFLIGVFAFKALHMELGKMAIPCYCYLAVISLMLAKAFSTVYSHSLPVASGVVLIIGAILFFISDTILATCKFGSPLPSSFLGMHGTEANLITYYLGQNLLAFSLALIY